MTPVRYIIQPDKTQSDEYCIFDVRTQKPIATGLSLDEARTGCDERNRENLEEIQRYL